MVIVDVILRVRYFYIFWYLYNENLKNNIGKELYVFFCINIYRIRICLELVLMGKILCGEER